MKLFALPEPLISCEVGMLSDHELLGLIDRKIISGVDVPPDPFTSESPIQPSSIDLHIGGIYLPGASAEQAGGENHPLDDYLLRPGGTVLIRSSEMLSLLDDVGGLAFPPAHFAVKALLVTNAGHVDPEYKGPLKFTVINMGHEPQPLKVHDRVGTLILFKTSQQPRKGWTTRRNGEPGRSPNTRDLRYLAPDFADMTARARDIAREEVAAANTAFQRLEQRSNRLIAITGILSSLFIAAIIAFFGFYSPVSKLETKVDTMREQFVETKRLDGALETLRSQQQDSIGQRIRIDRLEERTAVLEKKLRPSK
ncbi:MAG: hypothetical protein C5B47_05105 [Verrucomicrobia bacterium]|nr:MAG: hypothetical protein C5B47_05105 [Verrucomicrobiota bacterium]